MFIIDFHFVDLSLRPLTPPLDRVRIPDKIPTSPMDLSVHVKKEPAAPKPNESSPSSQPVDLTTGPKHPVATVKEEAAVDLSFSSNAQAESGKADSNEEENSDKLEASRSLLRAALQAKQDAKSQHPKLLQLLGDNNTPLAAAANAANLSKPLENMSAGQHPETRVFAAVHGADEPVSTDQSAGRLAAVSRGPALRVAVWFPAQA